MMLKRITAVLAAAAATVAALGLGAPAQAITNGQPDGGAHPFVGVIVFYDGGGNPTHRCSGTMISATTVLTAGHCTTGTASAQVWFDEHITGAGTGYPFEGGFTGSTVTYPGFTMSLPDTGDVGVVKLETAPGVGTASLAPVGTLDALATQLGQQETRFKVVGYGLQGIKPQQLTDVNRMRGEVRLVNLRSALTDGHNIHHTAAPGTGGGTCFGDSGGPVFTHGTNQIVAVTSFGLNQNCAGSGFGFRIDVADVRNFINQHL